MRRARNGRLIHGEADYQLQLIYLWYERDHSAALALLQSLRAAHRENPLFWRLIAEVEDAYARDVPASLQTYADLLAAAEAGGVHEVDVARVDARLGLARQLDALHETDRALATLEPIVREAAPRPYGALSLAHFQIGAAHDRLGDRVAAGIAWRAAIAAAPRDDPHHVREAVRRLQRRPVSTHAEAYRLSLEGGRLLERSDAAGAARALSRAAAMAPGEPVIAYRLGRALDALDQLTNALAQYEYAIVRHQLAPPSLASSFHLHAGRVFERRGERTRAAEMYRHAANVFGAGADARRDALHALARVQ
jgi:tetratricopeptide (TPR) repeat protein